MSYNDIPLLKLLSPVSKSQTADDTGVACLIWYDGSESTATVSVHSVVANTIRLIHGATTTDFLLTAAAYNTMGEVQDAINAVTGWHCKRIAATRAMNSYSGSLKLVAMGATNAKTSAGVTVNWDSSNLTNVRFAMGIEAITTDQDGNTIPAAARTSIASYKSLGILDPILSNTSASPTNQPMGIAHGAVLFSGASTCTFGGGGGTTWTITSCTDKADGEVFTYLDSLGLTTVTSKVASGVDGLMGPYGLVNQNGWIVIDISMAAAPSALSCTVYGAVGRL